MTLAVPRPSSNGSAPEGELARLIERALVRSGLLDARNLERARRVAAEHGITLDAAVTQLGLVGERALAELLASELGLRLALPEDYPDAAVLGERLKVAFLRKARALPLAREADRVVLAMANPLDRFTRDAVATATGAAVEAWVAVPIDLEAALARLYGDAAAAGSSAAHGEIEALESAADEGAEDAERLKDLASEAPVIRLVNRLIARAVESRASDIHIEPFEDRLRIRYRHDGVLQEIEAPPARLRAAIISRIKIMARLDIAERRLPQDGRIKLAVRGHAIDFRVSTIPSLHGETLVLRVLDRTAIELDFAKLGLAADITDEFRRTLALPNGIVLVTGPTGSGKTTTLYTALLHLNSVERKIVTVEDPIEYQLEGINQTHVKPQIGLTFATLLRAILRQDPDVIMVGEIRDLETAEIAVQAALTGHLVLSTLHTNSAAATVTRLRDMGVEDYLLTATLNGVLAQRLVRRLCAACKRPLEASPELVARFSLDRLGRRGPIVLHEAVGCEQCHGTGYLGRIAIAEYLRPSPALQRLILAGADQGALQRAAVEAGMRTLLESGVREALAGVTTLREVMRSVRDDG
ncbi:MAG: GspE/PulE family protein [Alphaproteobacteria bacterium]